tara:strand:+ start:294 stop:839 length:546 start_codon:yes stop_codon:yes gene_type:complete
MQIEKTPIPDLLIFKPKIYEDNRGFFYENFNKKTFEESFGREIDFVQDNHSYSTRGVLRGLHYQVNKPQGKLIRVTKGSCYDVAVDIRQSSKTFKKWFGVELSEENKKIFWIPQGFAHGFLVTSEDAEVHYKVTDYYSPKDERGIIWNDSYIGIEWPKSTNLIISEKDQVFPKLINSELFI